ncbi:BRCA1-A complex subunit Abraxas 1-like [Gracilinanus agilis]|uniref:BRCA1-A complex subunit Abraxas 1-like n=1 Tax=Gracilinanus agilis TaxID=191870 RepID=UPI001CFC83C4|nr:BRCA1-A complex subunit Abraxas 1-like [Gracilinanus agilis]
MAIGAKGGGIVLIGLCCGDWRQRSWRPREVLFCARHIEGFLVGELQSETTSTAVSDYPSDTIEVVNNTLDIQRYIPCHRAFSFYSSSGEVNEEILRKICGEKNVIGWYKFRCNSDQIITLREKILHKNLQRLLLNPGFVFLLLTPNIITESCSTYTMDYALHVLKDGFFQRMSLVVSNLAMAEEQGYKTVSGACTSIGFSQATCVHSSDFFDQEGDLRDIPKITQLCASMQEELQKASVELYESEKLAGKLLKDVKRLKEEIANRKRAKQAAAARSRRPEGEENVLLCQALRTFFPDQEYLQSSTLTLQGKQVPLSPCTTEHEHELSVVDELTLMVESSDEAPEDEKRGEAKPEPLELGDEKLQVLEFELKRGDESGDQEKVLAASVGPDEEVEDIEYQKSPTF